MTVPPTGPRVSSIIIILAAALSFCHAFPCYFQKYRSYSWFLPTVTDIFGPSSSFYRSMQGYDELFYYIPPRLFFNCPLSDLDPVYAKNNAGKAFNTLFPSKQKHLARSLPLTNISLFLTLSYFWSPSSWTSKLFTTSLPGEDLKNSSAAREGRERFRPGFSLSGSLPRAYCHHFWTRCFNRSPHFLLIPDKTRIPSNRMPFPLENQKSKAFIAFIQEIR